MHPSRRLVAPVRRRPPNVSPLLRHLHPDRHLATPARCLRYRPLGAPRASSRPRPAQLRAPRGSGLLNANPLRALNVSFPRVPSLHCLPLHPYTYGRAWPSRLVLWPGSQLTTSALPPLGSDLSTCSRRGACGL
ncbi:hypothetical protein ZWY2020_018065 [Hordeum vulgare]|nr:hypothetical protein ZWY2020_018065 [Hordeum vulgare]